MSRSSSASFLRCAWPSAFALAALLLVPRPSPAALVVFEIKDAARDTGWAILYDNTQVSNPVFVGNPNLNVNVQGRLTFDKTFNSLAPIDIEFIERPESISEQDHFGLRITINENVTNNSGTPWTAYQIALVDTNTVLTAATNLEVDNSHPGFAHYHSGGMDGTQSFAPMTRQGPASGVATYNLTGNFPSDNTPRPWTGIGLHQIHEQGAHRNFIFRQSPAIPEPASLSLLLISSASTLLRRRSS